MECPGGGGAWGEFNIEGTPVRLKCKRTV
jgi:hypothetical protein